MQSTHEKLYRRFTNERTKTKLPFASFLVEKKETLRQKIESYTPAFSTADIKEAFQVLSKGKDKMQISQVKKMIGNTSNLDIDDETLQAMFNISATPTYAS